MATSIEESVTAMIPAMAAEIGAKIKEHAAQTDQIKAAILAAARGIADKLAEAMLDQFAKKLTSYEGEKLVAAVFGPLLRGY